MCLIYAYTYFDLSFLYPHVLSASSPDGSLDFVSPEIARKSENIAICRGYQSAIG